MYTLKPGLRFIEGKMVILEEEVDNDRDGAEDKRVAIEMRKIANTIMPRSVEMEEDVPSNHQNSKLPILDMEMWWEGDILLHQHYAKPMASRESSGDGKISLFHHY